MPSAGLLSVQLQVGNVVQPRKPCIFLRRGYTERTVAADEEGVEGAAYTVLLIPNAGLPQQRETSEP